MNKKVLTLSLLIATLGIGTAGAADGSSPCVDGGFYAGLNGGISIGKVDISSAGWKNKNFKKHANVKKTKGLPSFEFLIGGDMRTGDVRFGVDLGIGTRFGKMKVPYEGCEISTQIPQTLQNKITIKTLWYAFLRPKIGYHFTPDIIGFLVLGLEASQTKVCASDITAYSQKFASAKKVRWNPTVGVQLIWNINDCVYTSFGYNWHIKKRQKVSKQLGAKSGQLLDVGPQGQTFVQGNVKSMKTQYHSIMVGVGYRF